MGVHQIKNNKEESRKNQKNTRALQFFGDNPHKITKGNRKKEIKRFEKAKC